MRSPGYRIALGILLLAAACSPVSQDSFTGRVVGISDGDTLRVLRGNRQVRVRLYGIDAPERGQAFGTRARQYLGERAHGKDVRVEAVERDRYGRVVGRVILPDGSNLNQEMVRAGFAWWYRRYAPDDRNLARLEQEAQRARRGLWADAHPIPPWEFRRAASQTDPESSLMGRTPRSWRAASH